MNRAAEAWAIVWWIVFAIGLVLWLTNGGLILHMTTLVVLPGAVASAFSCAASICAREDERRRKGEE